MSKGWGRTALEGGCTGSAGHSQPGGPNRGEEEDDLRLISLFVTRGRGFTSPSAGGGEKKTATRARKKREEPFSAMSLQSDRLM